MAVPIRERFRHAFNAFQNVDPIRPVQINYGRGYFDRPDRVRHRYGVDTSIVSAIYNLIAVEVASVDIFHVRTDEDGRYSSTIKSALNNCLTIEANKDQTARMFTQDLVFSMLNEGVCAVIPIDTSASIYETNSFDIFSMRTAKIVEWFPDYIRYDAYNDHNGMHEQRTVPKSSVAIFENPFYSVMNEPNSILKRLIRALNLLDVVDEQASAGKLDLIIQLPYDVKSDALRDRAERSRKRVEEQLSDSKYGIAYASATERITQLNRPVENNLLKKIEYLTSMLHGQLGLTLEVLNGSANEAAMRNFYNRTIDPFLNVICDEYKRKFLTPTARTQGQSIMYFRDAFKLVPVTELANVADKFTRNEILSSNEVRSEIGYKPSNDPKADQLLNKNIAMKNEVIPAKEAAKIEETIETVTKEGDNQNGSTNL